MDSTIHTPRLTLIRLQDTSLTSQHLEWFHAFWTDHDCTAWSLHGPTHTLEESQQWMKECAAKFEEFTYAIFVKNDSDEPGKLVGNIGLRKHNEPALPPSSDSELPLNVRSLGYAFFREAWGKGYATEAGNAIVEAYAASILGTKEEGKESFYLEAHWDLDNPASGKVLKKIGFSEVGWKEEEGKVFLNGAWRDGGFWVWGLWL